jgi:hypothetical protein
MRLFPILTLLLPLLTAAPLQADPWKLTGESDRRQITPDLFYCKRTAVRAADATEASLLRAPPPPLCSSKNALMDRLPV